ncbi:MAG: thioredoxin domain-containing protein, partial [Gammaproteobacteria bacterium]
MKHARLVFGLVLVLGLALVPFTAAHAHAASTTAAAPLTRGDVIKIVRQEIQREFALRDWQRYSGYIDEYRGADAASLFSLSVLDRATAIGDTKSPVRVIAYADYECPYCKTFETAIAPALHRKFHSQALFVYRFFPLDMHGQVARTEAIA